MTTNDLILLNELIDQRRTEIGEGLSEDEFFEIFSAEQVLKDDDLSYDEIRDGIVDGGGDGGIDSIYFLINDVLYDEALELPSLGRGASLRLVLIQSKTSSGFSEASIDKLVSSARDLFDLNRDMKDLVSVYNESLLRKIRAFRSVYLALVSRFPNVSFEYASAAKAIDAHPNVQRKVPDLERTIKDMFTPVEFSFVFFNARRLLQSARRNPVSTCSIRLAENPISTGQKGFVSLVNLGEFFNFITDENGHLKGHIFEGNVRDYQGKTEVNKEIRSTLDSPSGEDFWWLNNGVSLVCSQASLSGKTLTVEDAEIVNGLQTSREIFNALQGKDLSKESRSILLRVLQPDGEESRDRIIKATNSQTPIPAASLRATDKIHRDIEDYLRARGYFYDRRKNYYKNNGKPIKKILSIPYVAQSVMACALCDPANARARPSSLIKTDDTYRRIFSTDYPLDIFYKCPIIVRNVEDRLRQSDNTEHRSHANNIRFYVAMLWPLRTCGVPQPRIQEVSGIDLARLDDASIRNAVETVYSQYVSLGGTDQVAKGNELARTLIEKHKADTLEQLSQGLPKNTDTSEEFG